jgi:hypothetical protein
MLRPRRKKEASHVHPSISHEGATGADSPPSLSQPVGAPMKSARERAEEKREEKLESVREQVQSGSLKIRQMTDDERRRYPPRPAQPKRQNRW